MSGAYDPERIRGRIRTVRIGRMFRLFHRKHHRRPLGVVPAPSRFSDSDGNTPFSTQPRRCDAASGSSGAVRFTRRKRRELPRADVEARLVVSLRSSEALRLVDLRGNGPIHIAAPTAVAHDANHAVGRALSAAIYGGVPEADGFLFQSRFTGHLCIAVFDRAIGKLEAISLAPLIEHDDFLEALEDYEITLLSAPG